MNEYDFVVTVKVRVQAFDVEDAKSVIMDFLGPGPLDDIIEIVDLKVK